MLDYPTTRALKFSSLQDLIDDIYKYDSTLYSELKKSEGQYAYFDYIEKIRRVVDQVFYRPLPSREKNIADTIKVLPRSSNFDTCIVLNNNSLLGHVTVLRSIGHLLEKFSDKGGVKIICLANGGSNSNIHTINWKKALTQANLQVLDLSKIGFADRFIEVDSLLLPRQYIWWGWPPGQWIGPLLARKSIHRSVSFKYDFPAAERFISHHIGYGDDYANHIYDNCQIYGFIQYFAIDLIPTFSHEKKRISVKSRSDKNKSLSSKRIINIGTLGRSEKIAQKPFLEVVKDIMLKDNRVVFHWTGKEKPQVILDFFHDHQLSNRNIFHGWVKPYDYLDDLDIYLDTFPFGTGETFVLAGLMGIPLVAMTSPYEANFTNLMMMNPNAFKFICPTSSQYYCKVVEMISGNRVYCPSETSALFEDLFTNKTLTCSQQVAKFAKELDL